MDRKQVSNEELRALGKFQGTIDRNANFRQQAFEHNFSRNVKVVRLLGYLALMRQANLPMAGNVQCVAAQRQNFSSSKTMTHMGSPAGPMQAAHFLPGQILIAARPVWSFAGNPETSSHIEFLFAEVEHLPEAFNQADTAAEANGHSDGLCAALAHACKTLIDHAVPAGVVAGKISLELLQAAHKEWHQDAISALGIAAAKKESKSSIPPLVGDAYTGYTMESIAARSNVSDTVRNRDESARILHYYAEDQLRRTWQWVTAECQWVLREVEAKFKG